MIDAASTSKRELQRLHATSSGSVNASALIHMSEPNGQNKLPKIVVGVTFRYEIEVARQHKAVA